MTDVLIKEDTDTWRELQVRTMAEIGVMQLQAKELSRWPANHQKRQARKDAPTGFRKSTNLLML